MTKILSADRNKYLWVWQKKVKIKVTLGEVFGFPISNDSSKAKRYRKQKLCPYNNKVPNCTKDKANNPLGVCSVLNNRTSVITCPTRFREEWLIIENAAEFVFGNKANWTSLSEIKLVDKNGQSAGNIDFILVQYNDKGQLIDFASLEVQGVYISGNQLEIRLKHIWPNLLKTLSGQQVIIILNLIIYLPQESDLSLKCYIKAEFFNLGKRDKLLPYKNHFLRHFLHYPQLLNQKLI